MSVIDVQHLSYRYGKVDALRDVSFSVPEGAFFAILGPNGSGKTTLLHLLMGLRRPRAGQLTVLGRDGNAQSWRDRQAIGYVAEGQTLPRGMRIEAVEAYLAPLYPTWDFDLADSLRERFELDPKRRIRTLSRGEQMKAALLFSLAPRPTLLIMDEPFTGMDAMVKDELVRGVLGAAGMGRSTVVIASHDIGELELLADWVAVMDRGEMRVTEPMDAFLGRLKHVEVILSDGATISDRALEAEWMSLDRVGSRLSFVVSHPGDDAEAMLAARFPGAVRIEVRNASLREAFVAVSKHSGARARSAAA